MKKLSSIFIFTLLCGASKGFMKALYEGFIKVELNFYFNTAFRNEQVFKS